VRLMTSRMLATIGRTALAVGVLTPGVAGAAPQQPAELQSLELADLMNVRVQPVFGASWRSQPVTEAPAAVTIVTAEEIARHGYRTLADILRSVRGFYVTYDRNYSYVGVRGVAEPGDYNTRILLLVDGQRLNDNVFEQALVGSELGLDPAAFQRVEIIRGPASALYGTDAVFAVINVITKSGADLNGWRASADLGTLGSRRGSLAFGRQWESGRDMALFGSISDIGGADDLYFAEYDAPETGRGIARSLDGERAGQMFGRVTWSTVTLRGAATYREKRVPTAAFGTTFGDPNFETIDARQFVDAATERRMGPATVTARAYVHHFRYDGRYPYDAEDGTSETSVYEDYADGLWWGAEGRLSRPMPGRQRVTVGGELRNNLRQDQGGRYIGDPEPDFAVERSSRVLAAYAQDEIEVLPRVALYGGLRYDRYDNFDNVAPRVAVVYNRSEDEALKYLYGRAFRAPNAYELDYYTNYTGPNSAGALGPERFRSHELIWERYVSTWLRTSASAFVNATRDVITFRPTADDNENFEFVNLGRLDGRGLEFEAEVRRRSGLQAQASYVFQHTERDESGAEPTNSPRHGGQIRLALPGPAGLVGAVDSFWMSGRRTLAGGTVGAAFVANVTMRVPLSTQLTLTAQVRNLFDREYADPSSAEHRQDAIVQDGRTVRVGLTWRLRRS